jgi:hypothetical protein
MLDGVEEIVTIVARYRQIEELYRSRPLTTLKQDFERHLVSLYMHIITYQISATCYYRRNTMCKYQVLQAAYLLVPFLIIPPVRFLRSIPKLDDVSEVMAAIRNDDKACKDIHDVFDSSGTCDELVEQWKFMLMFHRCLRPTSRASREAKPPSKVLDRQVSG